MNRLPRKVIVTVIARSPAFEVELAPTESLFGRWSRYCLHYRPDVQQLDRDFAPVSPNWLVLSSPMDEAQWRDAVTGEGTDMALVGAQATAAQLIGLSPEASTVASGAGLWSPRSQQVATASSLRACWSCMALGFHSTLFQHYALRRCPLHGEPLSCACPRCGRPSSPRFRPVADRPFTCPKCDGLWLRTALPAYGIRYLALVGAMLDDRLKEVFPLANTPHAPPIDQADCRALGRSRRDADGACHARHVARWTIWPTLPSDRWVSFVERRHALLDWRAQPNEDTVTARTLSSHDATACLRALVHVCGLLGCSSDCEWLNLRLGIAPGGLRLDDNVSVVSAALHLTMCKYGKYASQTLLLPGKGIHIRFYDDIRWNGLQVGRRLIGSDSGNARLVVAEILGWFAASIVEVAKLTYLQDVDWAKGVCRIQFLPAWIVTRSGLHHVLRVRERASERSILRLLRRYPLKIKLRRLPHGELAEGVTATAFGDVEP